MTNACTILGIPFFTGTASAAVARMRDGGLLVVPAAPALLGLQRDTAYRESLRRAAIVLPDSALMVKVWNLLGRGKLERLSGLRYIRVLLRDSGFRAAKSFWIVPNWEAREKHLRYLATLGITVDPEFVYVAPLYRDVADAELLAKIDRLRPSNVVVTLGGGVQEQLGWYLEQRLAYRPAIHCVGAALSFESGDQVAISPLADRMGMGWFLRCVSNPRRYVSRYLRAFRLVPLMLQYREALPPLLGGG